MNGFLNERFKVKINRNDWEDYELENDDEKFLKKFPTQDSTKQVKKKKDMVRQKRKSKAREKEEALKGETA
jgi:hypothetical protein